MGKMLIIAEKPSVAGDIAKSLGGFSKRGDGVYERPDALISNGIGHLVELSAPEYDERGGDLSKYPIIPARFQLKPIEKTAAQLRLLGKLLKSDEVTSVVNACDAGREGELIFRYIYYACGCRKPMQRMWLQSMTPDAIRTAFQGMRPGVEFDALYNAAQCRAEADNIVGINSSRAITRLRERITGDWENFSAGRVQTPTLAIVVDREDAIRNFVPKDYWEVHATFGAKAGEYVGRWFDPSAKAGEERFRLSDPERGRTIADRCRGVAPSSVQDESKPITKAAPKLFDLTTLQREANQKFGFSAKQTLDIAQALYEKHKATTYPRTDATALPEDYIETAKKVLGTFSGTPYGEHAERVLQNSWVKADKRIFDNEKISDHFAIIPTGQRPHDMSREEANIYDLVVRRFIAVFHPVAEYRETVRVTVVAGESFRSSGRVLVREGWLIVYGRDAENDSTPALCPVEDGETIETRDVEVKALRTQPPARYTEATLLAAMEKAGALVDDDELREAMKARGLGTPATRAAMIEKLLAILYLHRRGKEIVPTDKGIYLIHFLRENAIESLTSPKMTGDWEHKLREMEGGKYRRPDFMAEIGDMTRNIIDVIRQRAGEAPAPQVEALEAACPKCQGTVQVQGKMFVCTGCDLKLWREVAQRLLSSGEASELLRKRVLPKLTGFKSKQGRGFEAGLRLTDEFKVEFVFEEQGGGEGGAGGKELDAPCPKCGGKVKDSGVLYACEGGDFKLWKKIAERPLSEQEACELIRKGSLQTLHGFKGRKGKFAAGLALSRDFSKVEFVFEPR